MLPVTAVIRRPVITEKSMRFADKGIFMVEVDHRADASDLRAALASLYGITAADVAGIRVQTLPAKVRAAARGRVHTRRRSEKRMIVALRNGKQIDFTAFVR